MSIGPLFARRGTYEGRAYWDRWPHRPERSLLDTRDAFQHAMKPLFYAGQPGDGYGWGTCNKYLRKELGKLFEIHHNQQGSVHGDVAVFMPIATHDLNPVAQLIGGRPRIGYCFFESELGDLAYYNSAGYDWIFAGSSWCVDRLKDRGIHHCSVLIQGVDHEIFKPMKIARCDKRFRIFSGGKFEFRKGQDIVIVAVAELIKEFHEIQLVTAWSNPWPELMKTMSQSPHIKWNAKGDTQEEFIRDLCRNNGIPNNGNLLVLPLVSHRTLASVMNQTDLGVFPNRVEGGTNLVLMEYACCGKPLFATNGTGHRDVVPGQCWISGEPTKLYFAIRTAFNNWNAIKSSLTADMSQWTWARAAKTIADKIEELQSVKVCQSHSTSPNS